MFLIAEKSCHYSKKFAQMCTLWPAYARQAKGENAEFCVEWMTSVVRLRFLRPSKQVIQLIHDLDPFQR